jgi:hypothetical protein
LSGSWFSSCVVSSVRKLASVSVPLDAAEALLVALVVWLPLGNVVTVAGITLAELIGRLPYRR